MPTKFYSYKCAHAQSLVKIEDPAISIFQLDMLNKKKTSDDTCKIINTEQDYHKCCYYG